MQLFDLSDGQRQWLANHLGHDISIHDTVYKRQEFLIEVTKVGKMLSAVDNGLVSTFAGCRLDAIDVNTNGRDRQATKLPEKNNECKASSANEHLYEFSDSLANCDNEDSMQNIYYTKISENDEIMECDYEPTVDISEEKSGELKRKKRISRKLVMADYIYSDDDNSLERSPIKKKQKSLQVNERRQGILDKDSDVELRVKRKTGYCAFC